VDRLETFGQVCTGRGALKEGLAWAAGREGHSTSALRARVVWGKLMLLPIVDGAGALHG